MNKTRIPTGKFVSESKFRANPAAFIPHIRQRNRAALEALITKPEVERQLLTRLQKKAETYGQDICADGELPVSNGTNGKIHRKIDPDGVVDLYESYIIPLTKEVEVCTFKAPWFRRKLIFVKVDYLLNRLEGLTKEEIEHLSQA
jgi:chorismate mutase